MTRVWRAGRVVVALLMLAAVIRLMLDGFDSGDFLFWNFFGYFTIQNNLIGATALLVAAAFTGGARPAWVEYLRACAATYLAIVVTVYWILLAPVSEDSPWTWTNLVVHGVSGVALVVDWLVEGPRSPLPLRTVWVVMAYPTVWLAVVLIRGATDGWFPYPFLDPANGYGSIAVVIVGIFVAGIAIGSLLFRATRWRVIGPRA
ncbi:Pr6Pr family membrane protein [Demequina sp.]|uniref:Pr6Pr family membrane protein n=1 Tax=Demequina sp. TaxID=2050685 RepID=UPI003D0F722D